MERLPLSPYRILDAEGIQIAKLYAPNGYEGLVYETFYAVGLEELVIERKILGFVQSEKDSLADSVGIDFWVISTYGDHIPVQITGCRSAAWGKVHRHPSIPCVHVRHETNGGTKTIDQLKDETVGLVKRYTRTYIDAYPRSA